MPAPATTMATQVRAASRCPRAMRASSAVKRGPSAIVTSTLATLVKASATMKAVNMTLQHRPEIHRAAPPCNTLAASWRGPRSSSSIGSSAAALKALRQKVISKASACSSHRDTTPAMLHSRVTSSIVATARDRVMFGLRRQKKGCPRGSP